MTEPHAAPVAPIRRDPRALRWAILLLTTLVLPAVAYAPITRNYFHTDDFFTLQNVVNDPLPNFLLRPQAGHVSLVRNLLFSLFFQAFGPRPEWYFLVVLSTHLLNVGLLFALVERLTGSAALACFGAMLWGVAPAHEGTLGWYSVYGHVIVATTLLLWLGSVARHRAADRVVTPGTAAAWAALVLAGSLSFGVGLGVALVFPLVVFLLLPRAHLMHASQRLVVSVPLLAIAAYWATHRAYAALSGVREDMAILVLVGFLRDWQDTVAMTAHLVAAGIAAVVGNQAYSLARYPDATGYTLAGAFVAATMGAAAAGTRAGARPLAAFAALAIGSYAIIAAGRAPLYAASPIFPAYGASLPRYHYVASLALAVLLCLLLDRIRKHRMVPPRVRQLALPASLAVIAGLYAGSDWRIDHFDADRAATGDVLAEIERRIAAIPPPRTVYLRNYTFGPAVTDRLFAGTASLYTIFYPYDPGQPVYFVEFRPPLLAIAPPGSRLSRVLVGMSGPLWMLVR